MEQAFFGSGTLLQADTFETFTGRATDFGIGTGGSLPIVGGSGVYIMFQRQGPAQV